MLVMQQMRILTLRKKCLYSELFWSVLCLIRTEYGEIVFRITLNTDTFHAVLVIKHTVQISLNIG